MGSTRSNSRTGPVASAAWSSAWSSTPGSSSNSRRAPSVCTSRTPGTPASQSSGAAGHVDPAALEAPGAELVHRAAGDHPAPVDDAHAVAQPLDELELVAREDDGDSCVRPFAEHVRHHVDGDRVEPGERLVEDEHVRSEDEGGGQLDALLVAQAERLELGVAPVGEAEAVQPARARRPGRPRRSCRAARRGRPAAPPRASWDRGRAPRACSRCGAGPRRSGARPASAPRRHRARARPARSASWSSCRRRCARRTRTARRRGPRR